jgi:acyl-CoA reductase-like NAD-dependent aldehyde dehydrogenase
MSLATTEVAQRKVPLLIGGEHMDAESGETFELFNPATREVIGEVARGRAPDVSRAVAAAAAAFPAWDDRKPRERGKALRAIAVALAEHAEEIARTVALESGNAIRTQARPEVMAAVEILDYFGSTCSEVKGMTVPLGSESLNYTVRRPYGVVGAVTPWNVPVATAVLKAAMGLATGNTIVLKPAEDACLAMSMVAAIAQEHLPPGVLNVVPGYGEEAGQALLNDPGICKLSFTGSTAVGTLVMQAAAKRVLPVSLELGGKSPTIVFPDSDDEEAAAGVISGMRFARQGQSCTAGSRLFLHADIYDSFLEKLRWKLGELRVGDPLDEETDIGAIINIKQFDRVCGFVREAVDGGAGLVTGSVPEPSPRGGLFMEPIVLRDVQNDWRIAREEVFGPVLVAIPWNDERTVIEQANDSTYGLAGFVWCRDISRAIRTAHAIDSGWVQINAGGAQQVGQPFGGMKHSGLGRENSIEGAMESYMETKAIDINLMRQPAA